jgi:hypothetical protein
MLSIGGKAHHCQNRVLDHDSGGQHNDVNHDPQLECRVLIGPRTRVGLYSEIQRTGDFPGNPSKVSAVEE